MKNITRYLLFVLFISCIFISKVNAECSYQERKDLLNAAKGVDIGYEVITDEFEDTGEDPDTGEISTYKSQRYSFKFYINNISDNIFIKYYNDFNSSDAIYVDENKLQDGIYYFTDYNTLNIYNYYFEVYSQNNNCPGNLVYTHKIVKPKYNYFSTFSICEKVGMDEYKNCDKFITKPINKNESDFVYDATKYYNEKHPKNDTDKENNKILKFLSKYWYVFSIVALVVIVAVIFIIRFIKKRGELK